MTNNKKPPNKNDLLGKLGLDKHTANFKPQALWIKQGIVSDRFLWYMMDNGCTMKGASLYYPTASNGKDAMMELIDRYEPDEEDRYLAEVRRGSHRQDVSDDLLSQTRQYINADGQTKPAIPDPVLERAKIEQAAKNLSICMARIVEQKIEGMPSSVDRAALYAIAHQLQGASWGDGLIGIKAAKQAKKGIGAEQLAFIMPGFYKEIEDCCFKTQTPIWDMQLLAFAEKYSLQHDDINALIELAVFRHARELWYKHDNFTDRFEAILTFAEKYQPKAQHKNLLDSQIKFSMHLAVAAVANHFCQTDSAGTTLNPCAGNGLSMFAARKATAYVNDINPQCTESLKFIGFDQVTAYDLSTVIHYDFKCYDAVICFPPFAFPEGYGSQSKYIGVLPFETDHDDENYEAPIDIAICSAALTSLEERKGRAAIVVNAAFEKDDEGMPLQHRSFFIWLLGTFKVRTIANFNPFFVSLSKQPSSQHNACLILLEGREGSSDYRDERPREIDIQSPRDFLDIFESPGDGKLEAYLEALKLMMKDAKEE